MSLAAGAPIDGFYLTFAQIAFALLGLWWVVIQLKYSGGAGGARRRRHAYAVALFFLIPGVMSLLSAINSDITLLWRLAFAISGAVGLIEILLYLASEGRRTGAGTLLRLGSVIIYVLIILVAAWPGITEELDFALSAREVEAILLGLILVFGVNVAWLALTESEETAGA
jgi:hypothetical protein